MGTLVVALLALLGSSAAAAWVTNTWQRRRYEAEMLQEGFRRVAEAQSAFVLAISACVSLFRVHGALGKIWDYQRRQFEDSMERAGCQLVALNTAQIIHGATHPEAGQAAGDVVQAARDTIAHLGLVAFIPIQDAPAQHGVRIDLGNRQPDEVADALVRSVHGLAHHVGKLTVLTANRHRQFVRGLRLAFPGLVLFVVLASVAYYWCVEAWHMELRADNVIWIHRVSGHAQVRALPPTPPGGRASQSATGTARP